jgi:hypothetical protein
MRKLSLLLVPMLCLGLSWHARAANNESPTAEMTNLNNAGQYQQAF